MTEIHHFAVYETATGKVVRTGSSANPRILGVQRIGEGQALYVGKIDPDTTYLPGGVPSEKAAETRVVPASEVKAWAGRILSYSDWYVTRQYEGGPDVPAEILTYRQEVRDRSGEIEAMSPIPVDFRDPKWWPVAP